MYNHGNTIFSKKNLKKIWGKKIKWGEQNLGGGKLNLEGGGNCTTGGWEGRGGEKS